MSFHGPKFLVSGVAILTATALLATTQSASAKPSDPTADGQRVATSVGGEQVSWRTPPVPSRHAHIANDSSASGAGSTITLNDNTAPTSYSFVFTLPAKASLASDGRGGYDVLQSITDGIVVSVGHLDAPWAKDTNGKHLATSYTQDGLTITQHVATTGARFPVTADPHFTWGWITGTVYFSKSETAKAAASIGFLGSTAFLGPPPFNVILGLSAAYYTLVAGWAQAEGKCLSIKSAGGAGIYSGGTCR